MDVCIKCGIKRGKKPFKGLFCVDCYTWKVKIPKKVEIKVCKRCGRIWLEGKWKKISEEELEKYLLEKIKSEDAFEGGRIDFEEKKVILYFVADEGEKVEKEFRYPLEFHYVLCEDCYRKAAGYYEAIIQLRGDKEKQKGLKKILEKALEKRTFITKIKERKEGVDIYVGSSKVVFEILRKLGIKAKISRKLHTQKEGKRIYRITFAIRL